jgi:hypothetical protein
MGTRLDWEKRNRYARVAQHGEEPIMPIDYQGVSEAEIEAARTKRGGWTKDQLAEWGVPWPPPKGWRKSLIAASMVIRRRS